MLAVPDTYLPSQLHREHPHYRPFKEVQVAPRLILAEVIVPGYVRNDLYLTLIGADVTKEFSKLNDRNVEVIVRVYDEDNVQIKVIKT